MTKKAPVFRSSATASFLKYWGTRLPMAMLATAWVAPSMIETEEVRVLTSRTRLRAASARTRSGPAPLTCRPMGARKSTVFTV